ncbi:peptide ABC transporter permease [Bacillus sp. KH172YL63]|nr:peptide ABC transporter permease [Bacillus sp. KH172YL63]
MRAFISSFQYLFNPGALQIPQYYGEELAFFNIIGEKYFNTMIILITSFLIAIILSLVVSFLYIKSNEKIKRTFSSFFFVLESVPDVLMVIILQFSFVMVYKFSGWSLGITAITNDGSLYLLPIICLSVIPTIQLFKYFSSYVEEEQKKTYSEFLKAKGLSENYIIVFHLFKNSLIQFISQSKNIILFMLSNLLILELVLNIDGLMGFIKTYGIGDHRILMWCLILIYLPFLLFYKSIHLITEHRTSNGGSRNGA